eukprot:397030-Pelagomonas_calceolata.AAC.1
MVPVGVHPIHCWVNTSKGNLINAVILLHNGQRAEVEDNLNLMASFQLLRHALHSSIRTDAPVATFILLPHWRGSSGNAYINWINNYPGEQPTHTQ